MSETCLFCQIASGAVEADIVLQDEHVVAFRDINPQAPDHVLIIPRTHVATLSDATGEAGRELLGRLMEGVQKTADELGLTPANGYRTVVNCGERAAQSVFHLHVHLLGGRMFGWPPG